VSHRRRRSRSGGGAVIAVAVIALLAMHSPGALALGVLLAVGWVAYLARRNRQLPPGRPRHPLPPGVRPLIPKEVKRQVWIRDGGRCRHCRISDSDCMARYGEHLQYDHIVPWSWTKNPNPPTADEIQLSCPPDNQAKGARWAG
jgi:5-methylcytosine-specific restriction endonuclease McrA